jgi:hypothetical protein
MIEDAMATVKALNLFCIRILANTAATAAAATATEGSSSSSSSTSNINGVHIEMIGREVILYLPPSILSKLPSQYSEKASTVGVLLKLNTFLFTQVSQQTADSHISFT